jgi:hypothetical protein
MVKHPAPVRVSPPKECNAKANAIVSALGALRTVTVMGGILFSCLDTRGRQPSLMEAVDRIDAAAHGLAISMG